MACCLTEKEHGYEHVGKPPSLTEEMFNTPREDTLIPGGDCDTDRGYEISQMNEGHVEALSFIYNNQLFVVGGLISKAEVMNEINDMKENLSKVNKDVDEVKVMMSQMLEKFNMLGLLSKLPSPTQGNMFHTPREDILIAGGDCHSSEIFSWEKNGWYVISQTNKEHMRASSFIYNDQLFVVQGYTKTIETLDLNELPLKWMEFSDELPHKCTDHETVVFKSVSFTLVDILLTRIKSLT
jgi:hypothetical protein